MTKALQSPRRMLACIASGILATGIMTTATYAQFIPIQNVSTTGTLGQTGSASVGLANLTDGNFTGNSYQEWLGAGSATLDLGSVQTVDRLVVAMRPVGDLPVLAQGFVEISLDGLTWVRVKDFDNTGAVSSGNILALGFYAQQARYVRFTMDTPGLNVQVGELRLYNGDGPRVSLMSRGSDDSWSASNNTANPPRTPFNLVDRDPNTFALFAPNQPGEIILRLDSVEYDNGWSAITIGIRGGPSPGGPNNPGIINVAVGDGSGNWSDIFSETFAPVTSIQELLLEMDEVRHEKYIRISYLKGSVPATNFQFRDLDVLPVPEPSTVMLGVAGMAMLAFLKRRRKLQEG